MNASIIENTVQKSNPLPVTYADILDAARKLEGVAHRTPVLTSRQANERAGAELFFKCENFQRAGCSGFRGAYYAVSGVNTDRRHLGIIFASLSNYGQAVALSAKMLGIAAIIVAPNDAPRTKIAAMRAHGAQVVFYDRIWEDGEAIAKAHAERFGWVFLPLCDPKIIAGQGTAAKELIEEVGPLDYLFVSTGTGSLLAGSATAAAYCSPTCKVIGVEPETGNDAQRSIESGELITIPAPSTIADGARQKHIGELALPILKTYVHTILTANDNQVRRQLRFFAERMKIVAEPTACLAAAPVLDRQIDVSGKRVGIIVSGGNMDPLIFSRCLRSDGTGRT